jgi:hypothetical protein
MESMGTHRTQLFAQKIACESFLLNVSCFVYIQALQKLALHHNLIAEIKPFLQVSSLGNELTGNLMLFVWVYRKMNMLGKEDCTGPVTDMISLK